MGSYKVKFLANFLVCEWIVGLVLDALGCHFGVLGLLLGAAWLYCWLRAKLSRARS